jgi:hypothetical protein
LEEQDIQLKPLLYSFGAKMEAGEAHGFWLKGTINQSMVFNTR